MNKKLYLECNAGISGDMMVAALLDLGVNEQVLKNVLETIPIHDFSVEITRKTKAGIDCCDFCVNLKYNNHDHDMEYLHSNIQTHENTHNHLHHAHRGINEITEIINKTVMSNNAKKIALKIFEILAVAEAKAHAVAIEDVHFHEVGAIDSIVDIIAVAVCLDELHAEEIIIPKLCEGYGTVRCQHGILPIPVPAVSNILEQYPITIEFINVEGEFVTPTGAAIAAAIQTSDKLPTQFQINKIGIGAGKRNYDRPSMLRAMLIEDISNKNDVIYKLESNIDDCTGEALAYVMNSLFKAGAKDVHYLPIYMKKNRPAWQLNVICDKEDIDKLEHIIFRETTTIGIRRQCMERTVLPRKNIVIDTPWGTADVKICYVDNEKKYYPEYESVAKIANQYNISFQEIYNQIINLCF